MPFMVWVLATITLLLGISVLASIVDIRERIIPDKLILVGLVAVILLRLWYHPNSHGDYFLGALVCGAALYSAANVSKGQLGGGDIKLYFVLGGIIGLYGALLSLVFFSIITIIMMLIARKWASEGFTVPLAPVIGFSSILAFVLTSI